jgi:hypothetical protein
MIQQQKLINAERYRQIFSVPEASDGKPAAFVSLVWAHSVASVTQEPAPGMHGIELGGGPEVGILAKALKAPVVAAVTAWKGSEAGFVCGPGIRTCPIFGSLFFHLAPGRSAQKVN